jgi:hypothetical protein
MKLKVFSHLVDLPGGYEIAVEQVDLLIKSGLFHNAEIYFHCNYNQYNFNWLTHELRECSNVHFLNFNAQPEEFETPTLMHIKDVCDNTDEVFYALYMHQKGIRHPDASSVHAWRRYMQYFNIEKWRDCVEKLDAGYDAVGVDWRNDPWKHFSGNFWWARSDYIRKLPQWQRPKNVGYKRQFSHIVYDPYEDYRMENELWIGLANPNWYSMHEADNPHYQVTYPPEKYRT